jgi:hypothetical protein
VVASGQVAKWQSNSNNLTHSLVAENGKKEYMLRHNLKPVDDMHHKFTPISIVYADLKMVIRANIYNAETKAIIKDARSAVGATGNGDVDLRILSLLLQNVSDCNHSFSVTHSFHWRDTSVTRYIHRACRFGKWKTSLQNVGKSP